MGQKCKYRELLEGHGHRCREEDGEGLAGKMPRQRTKMRLEHPCNPNLLQRPPDLLERILLDSFSTETDAAGTALDSRVYLSTKGRGFLLSPL